MSANLPRPFKKWGQNFLVDPPLREKIMREMKLTPDDLVVEVGPGTGVLTELLLPAVRRVHAVELDQRMSEYLDPLAAQHSTFTWEQGDFLDWAPENDAPRFRLFGNLPFYISSPLILKTFALRGHLIDAHFLLQKEMARRLAAEVGTKSYGILTVYARLFGRVKYLFDISRNVFYPKPEVDSGFISITFPEVDRISGNLELTLRAVVRSAFQHRRKTLHNSLGAVLPDSFVLGKWLDETLRADAVTPEQYLELARTIVDFTSGMGLTKPVY
ncbi:MAG TPA: ribosomal RNA small subunit methyltransferase A [Candidatus Marinimicrobia bacterium]|nr:MAG: ribosomal RNA small subunit methyltransferase A [Candidatus Marinimicrobia bacterium CG1_02_48_14]PJA54857.1 MAG: ribosomal RNA small subunit methyltransferase A [Candidatus Marinimicrobia bacterium CG_4_9_14_3_um_filter_48_9]HCW75781.1 ribosomal RNA small subunit methyltransferase A [Candidatus Neomarinimicrobiota bacterium]